MFSYVVKTVLVFFITFLASVCPAGAAVKKQMDAAAKYYDDIGGTVNLQELKKKRDAETQKIREEIFARRPALKSDRAVMASKVVDRKVRIAREKKFLRSEFDIGLDMLYAQGVARFSLKDYAASRRNFQDIEKLSPGFKETRDYLKKLESASEKKSNGRSGDMAMNIQPAGFKGEKK